MTHFILHIFQLRFALAGRRVLHSPRIPFGPSGASGTIAPAIAPDVRKGVREHTCPCADAQRQCWGEARAGRRRGQSMVEFALMLVILTILLLGVLDLGRAYFTYIAMMDAAGEGATFGSVNPMKWCNAAHDYAPTCPGSDYENVDPNNIVYRVVQSAPEGSAIDWSQTTVQVELEGSLPVKPGRKLTVTLTTNYKLLTPFVGTIVGDQILPLSARASAVVLAP